MDLSVIIPSHQRAEKLFACLDALAHQTLEPDRYEVLVGLDGADEVSEWAAERAWGAVVERACDAEPHGGVALAAGGLRIVTCRRQGYNGVRNELLGLASGRYLVSLNDDVLPDPEFLEAHLGAQDAAHEAGRPAIVAGYSPFRVHADDTLFDRLLRETSMVFFYDRMVGSGARGPALDGGPDAPEADAFERPAARGARDRDWGFRHCWGMNFSAPLAAVREAGAFTAFDLAYGYDDIELAYRLTRRFGMPVLFRPEARADHDHRYTPREVLDRERRLGRSAWLYAGRHPEFARAVFGRDIRAEAEVAYSREFVEREGGTAERLERSFLGLAEIPARAVDWSDARAIPSRVGEGRYAARLVNLVYEQHLLLKRWWWRRGLLEAAGAVAPAG